MLHNIIQIAVLQYTILFIERDGNLLNRTDELVTGILEDCYSAHFLSSVEQASQIFIDHDAADGLTSIILLWNEFLYHF